MNTSKIKGRVALADNGLKFINRVAGALAGIRLIKGKGYWYWMPVDQSRRSEDKKSIIPDIAENWLHMTDLESVSVDHFTHLPFTQFEAKVDLDNCMNWLNEIRSVMYNMRKEMHEYRFAVDGVGIFTDYNRAADMPLMKSFGVGGVYGKVKCELTPDSVMPEGWYTTEKQTYVYKSKDRLEQNPTVIMTANNMVGDLVEIAITLKPSAEYSRWTVKDVKVKPLTDYEYISSYTPFDFSKVAEHGFINRKGDK